MKQFLLFFTLAVTFVIAAAQQAQPSMQHVSSGTLVSYHAFPSQHIPPRDVTVWLPDGYCKGDPCAVLYMHDGQMLFDSTTTWNKQEWQVDEVLGQLIAQGRVRPAIVVAIDNTKDRITEYFPAKIMNYVSDDDKQGIAPAILTADAYLRFLTTELKPFIDREYHPLTAPHFTSLMGSSMGGLISLYGLCEYPDVFGRAACLSTHSSMMMPAAPGQAQLNNEPWATALRAYLNDHLPGMASHRLYMDRGTVDLDGSYGPYQDAIDALITGKGWTAPHYESRVFEGHIHNERCWAARLATPLTFLLAP